MPGLDIDKAMADRVATVQDKIQALLDMYGFAGVVMLKPLESESSETLIFRAPKCATTCPSPQRCDVQIFMEAGEFAITMAHDIIEGTAMVRSMKVPDPQ